ncbi:Topoisomerase I damage affected protein, partial [Actinidia chinensis var. chinensis]
MERNDDKDFYRNFSKKKLQELCRSYGLSPYMTKPNLVNSLYSYFKATGFTTFRDLEYPLYDLTCKKRGTFSSKNELECNENGFGYIGKSPRIILDNDDLSFAREVGVSDAPQIRSRNLNDGACLAENAYTSSIKSSKPITSFEFYVSSEEGINLIVDMNASPSDWSKEWGNKVCSCHNKFDNKFGSLRAELHLLGNSNKQIKFPWSTDSDQNVNNGDTQAQSFPYSITREGDSLVVDHPYGGDGFSRSYIDAMEMSMQLEEDKEHPHFSTPNYDVRNHVISVAEYGPIDRETVTLESSVINIPQTKLSSNSVNSTQECQKCPDLLEHQNSEVDYKSCEDQSLQNTSTNVSPSRVYPGFSSSWSIEMQSPEVVSQRKDASCSPCGNDGSLDAVDAMLNMETTDDDLANSSTSQDNMSACAKERERSKPIYRAETSESLQLTESVEKKSEESEADELQKRKRQHSEGEDLNGCGEHNTRDLRSGKRLLDRTLPRRSMWLVSK